MTAGTDGSSEYRREAARRAHNCVEVRILGRCTVVWFKSMQARGVWCPADYGVAGSLHTVVVKELYRQTLPAG